MSVSSPSLKQLIDWYNLKRKRQYDCDMNNELRRCLSLW